MANGTVVSLHVVPGEPGEGNAPDLVDEFQAVAGKGLAGDRYFDTKPDSQVTLIESESIDAMARNGGPELAYGEARRNIVTRGVDLNGLVDKEFKVGEVTIRGSRLSEPCQHLADLTGEQILKGLLHRGGLKAQILNDGVLRVGDAVRTQ